MRSKRDFISIADCTSEMVLGLLQRADQYRIGMLTDPSHRPLSGKTLAMLFSKASTRTRVSFEVGVFQLGGHALMLSDRDSQIGRGEPIADTARVLSGYVDGVMIRTFEHGQVESLAQFASVPVINGLTDFNHPCQLMADLLTCRAHWGENHLSQMRVAWCGDGNNMARSWLHAATVLGFELRLAMPSGYGISSKELAVARSRGAQVLTCTTPMEAAEGAHVVTTDVWASMGQESEAQTRHARFTPYQVNDAVMSVSASDSIFLHCLPAHRGEEVTASVVDGEHSKVWQQAENRLHAQKAILEWTMGGFCID